MKLKCTKFFYMESVAMNLIGCKILLPHFEKPCLFVRQRERERWPSRGVSPPLVHPLHAARGRTGRIESRSQQRIQP